MEPMDKKSIRKLVSIACVIASLLNFSCERKTPPQIQSNAADRRPDTLFLKEAKKWRFKYDNGDSTSFGVEFFDHGFPLGQPSLALDNEVVYVVDAFHNNIKKINLNTGSLVSSEALSKKRLLLNDIIIFDDALYVSSELDTIFVLNSDLDVIKRFSLNKGRSTFTRSYADDSLIVFYPDSQEYLTLSKDDRIVRERVASYEERGKETFFKNKLVKDIGENLYQTNVGIVFTKEDLFQNDVDFDSTYVVAIRQDTSDMVLSIFRFQPTQLR